ncbi:unnamed protein product [Echinostoma caproni]|uniref:GCP_C_terminal domain-containing protein n=1 Tax=Echinostoma caproni TaxID=27848 RepID=A0A183BCX5_9TREM|nr:unnamed protein product [Echinostoma caproni]
MQRDCYIPEPAVSLTVSDYFRQLLQRIPLTSSSADPDVPEEFSEVVNMLKSASDQHLFQWKEFPVELPSSILDVSHVPLANIFSAPEFDECELLSKDSHGNSKPLNRHQLIQLRRTAEFDVDSINFIGNSVPISCLVKQIESGEVHTWKISPFFLKGTDNIRKTLLEDLQAALAELVIHAHDRVVSKQFSMAGALRVAYRDCFIRFVGELKRTLLFDITGYSDNLTVSLPHLWLRFLTMM